MTKPEMANFKVNNVQNKSEIYSSGKTQPHYPFVLKKKEVAWGHCYEYERSYKLKMRAYNMEGKFLRTHQWRSLLVDISFGELNGWIASQFPVGGQKQTVWVIMFWWPKGWQRYVHVEEGFKFWPGGSKAEMKRKNGRHFRCSQNQIKLTHKVSTKLEPLHGGNSSPTACVFTPKWAQVGICDIEVKLPADQISPGTFVAMAAVSLSKEFQYRRSNASYKKRHNVYHFWVYTL